MPKVAKVKTPIEIQRLVTPGFHSVGYVPGLHLRIKPTGTRYWVLRATVGALRRDIGLGAYPGVTLAEAREKAKSARDAIATGTDPVDTAREARSALKAAQAKAVTFEEAAAAYIATHKVSWSNQKHAKQWTSTLTTYAYPVIGSMLVRHVEQAHVLKILGSIWETKTETATRLRSRIESVMDWARGRGYCTGDNPAAWKGNLDAQLPAPEKVTKVKHHSALPANQVGSFMSRLKSSEGVGARALEFVILTAARSGEVRGATWAEIDLKAKLWTVPAERMKMRKEHRVPLSEAAIRILNDLSNQRVAGVELIFAGSKGGAISDMTMTALLRRMEVDAVPHGFRSTFRDWVSECTNYPGDVAEMALAHAIGDKVEAAYRRGDLFEKRRRLMDDWAAFLALPSVTDSNVIPMNRAQA